MFVFQFVEVVIVSVMVGQATADMTPPSQNRRSSTLHSRHGAPVDPSCWYCRLRLGSAGSAPSLPCLDLDPSICPRMIALLVPPPHSQHGWPPVQSPSPSPSPFSHSEALSWESVASECLGLFSLSR